MLVVPHGVPVGEGPDLVLQHLLVDAEVGVRVEVVVLGGHLLAGQVLQLLVLGGAVSGDGGLCASGGLGEVVLGGLGDDVGGGGDGGLRNEKEDEV